MAHKYPTTTITIDGKQYVIETLHKMVVLGPDKGGPALLFLNPKGVPTHVAIWNKEILSTLMSVLNVVNQNLET